jgi:hypothetical protein
LTVVADLRVLPCAEQRFLHEILGAGTDSPSSRAAIELGRFDAAAQWLHVTRSVIS